jgi:hypothetical protein
MTAITPLNLPVPPGAEADEWMILTFRRTSSAA